MSDNSGLRRLVHRVGFDILPSDDPDVRALRPDLRKDAGVTIEPVHPQHPE